MIWNDWDLDREFTKTVLLKNTLNKLQKLHVRSFKLTWTHHIIFTKASDKKCWYLLSSDNRLTLFLFVPSQASSVQVFHHLNSRDSCSQSWGYFLHPSYFQTVNEGKGIKYILIIMYHKAFKCEKTYVVRTNQLFQRCYMICLFLSV